MPRHWFSIFVDTYIVLTKVFVNYNINLFTFKSDGALRLQTVNSTKAKTIEMS